MNSQNLCTEIIQQLGKCPMDIRDHLDHLPAKVVTYDDIEKIFSWTCSQEKGMDGVKLLSVIKERLLQCEVSSYLKVIHCPQELIVNSTNIEDVYSKVLNEEPNLSVSGINPMIIQVN